MKKLTAYIFYITVFLLLISFNFNDKIITGGWYQQWLPNLNGEQLKDITFLDSLTGYGISNTYIIKTTNGGDNWVINSTANLLFSKVHFINKDTGYVSAGLNKLYKTFNGGLNWTVITLPMDLYPISMYVLNKDTLWLCDSEGLTGGLFRTTDGGYNWIRQFYLINYNPDKIYMFNSRIGFLENTVATYKTTNGGNNWFQSIAEPYTDIHFVDSLTGWKIHGFIKKTTNGGINWVTQSFPNLFQNQALRISRISKDTIWGVGGSAYYGGSKMYGIVYKTTNSGNNWGYQQPDTLIDINVYNFCNFYNRNIGWGYAVYGGIHTVVGGNDTTFYTSISNITQIPPKNFELKQNYPNPYNNSSLIEYYVNEPGWVKLKIYDISGKEMGTLVNEEQNTGGYGVPVSIPLSSGVYFYKMVYVNRKGEMQMDTKKMIVIK